MSEREKAILLISNVKTSFRANNGKYWCDADILFPLGLYFVGMSRTGEGKSQQRCTLWMGAYLSESSQQCQ